MDAQNKITNEDLAAAFVGEDKAKKATAKAEKAMGPGRKASKRYIIYSIVGGVGAVAGVVCLLLAFLVFNVERAGAEYPAIPSREVKDVKYSALTGEALAESAKVDAPAYCVQMPNGTDGARPQAGLTDAGVVFEAIAEAGITRFAAVYQDPTMAIIGPVRSLRTYYLQWDTPFDCTIVHAGGSGDALAAVANGYKDLSEDYAYMYRGSYGGRLWNNLFTTSAYLRQFSADHGYDKSDIKGFARMTPTESEAQRSAGVAKEQLNITKATTKDTSEVTAPVGAISLNLGGWADFNVDYTYDTKNNQYLRGYESGVAHEVYSCGDADLGERNPEDACTLTQVAPSVVVAIVVKESLAADNYHEDIAAIGSGKAYIFQNGTAMEGNWKKSSAEDQIKFTDDKGTEIKLAPGQTFITAVPDYGSVDY